jgi:hypothetical protein
MPQYFFHIDDGSNPDTDGVELADLATAKCEAVKVAGNIICEAAGDFWSKQEWAMTVTDESGLTLFALRVIGTEAPVLHTP